MGNFDHDNSHSDHEWDDSWETVWNEFDWERYLSSEDNEIKKYQKLYNKLLMSQNRLDEVAIYMGWDGAANQDALPEAIESSADSIQDQPYTLHKHPLFIASKALHSWLIDQWTQHIALCSSQIGSLEAVKLQQALSQSDYYGLLAVTALDVGDYSLGIAYFKRGMSSVNLILSLLDQFDMQQIEALTRYSKQARIRLFDIREIWLRVMADCRTAVANKRSEEE